MGFWQNVDNECEYRGISRKELAKTANFSVNTISSGIKRNGMPTADLALRISKVLNVPLEKLLDISIDEKPAENVETEQQDRKLFFKYLPLIKKISQLKTDSQKAVFTIVENLN